MVPGAGAAVAYYEITIISDTAGDFQGNGALDLAFVHLGEKFAYNPDQNAGKTVVDIRLEVRSLGDLQSLGNQAVRYEFHYKTGGTASVSSVTASWAVGATGSAPKPEVQGSGYSTADSIVIRIDAEAAGIAAGSAITESWATTALVSGDTTVVQDVAPHDNKNAPQASNEAPETFGAPYTASGGFPFITVESVAPLAQYSVEGGEVTYSFQFQVAAGVADDKVLVFFSPAPGWKIVPSRGVDEPEPRGEFTNVQGGDTLEFSFTMSHGGKPPPGTLQGLVMEVISLSGGHVLVDTTTTVSGAKITLPSYTFTLKTPGPFKAESASSLLVEISSLSAGGLVEGAEVSADFVFQNKLEQTVFGSAKGKGQYEFDYNFPQPGAWTVDAYVSSLSPSPHQEFTVEVEKKGGLSPGVGPALVVLTFLLPLGRRRDP